MNRSMLTALLLVSLLCPSIHANVLIQPTPTPTTPFFYLASNDTSISKPTSAPRAVQLAKRDNVQATLSLYQDWAAVCNGNDDSEKIDTKNVDANLRQLWQTVTETVYCGNNRVKTVTKTVTAVATATETVSSDDDEDGSICDSQCWSDYLWRNYHKDLWGEINISLTLFVLYRYLWLRYQCRARIYRHRLHHYRPLLSTLWISLLQTHPGLDWLCLFRFHDLDRSCQQRTTRRLSQQRDYLYLC